MAAVHFVITIPTAKEEYRLENDISPGYQKSCAVTPVFTSSPSDAANLSTPITTGTFPTRRKSETRTALGGDLTGNQANSASPLDIEAGVMPKTWEGLRDLLSSSRWTAHKNKESHHLNLPPDTCMEIVLRELLQVFRINNAIWTMDSNGQKLQVAFTVDINETYEHILEILTEWGIGDRNGSTVSVMNCIAFITSSRENSNEKDLNDSINLQRESTWDRFMNSVRSRLNVAQIVRGVQQEASITFDFIVLVVSAAILASFGLVEDSSIFLASSMLISPLMGPIIAAIFGTAIKDHSLRALGLFNELLGILIATFVGFLFGLVVCSIDKRYGIGEGLTNEMLSRCELHSLVVGIFTAIASGAAAAVGVLGGNIGSLVGVAISASLLPPAVNSGLLWALAFLYKFYEADSTQYNSVVKTSIYSDHQAAELAILGLISMCLTISNVICVYVMGIIVLKIKEIAPVISRNNRQFWKHDIKIARDLNRNGLDADAAIIDDFAALPKEDQYFIKTKNLERSSYQNTWSPSGYQFDSYQLPHGYCTVHHLKDLYSNISKGSTFAAKHRNKFNLIRRQKSRSVDLGHYQILAVNITPQATTPDIATNTNLTNQPLIKFASEIDTSKPSREMKGRKFIVTPASDQLHCPDGKNQYKCIEEKTVNIS